MTKTKQEFVQSRRPRKKKEFVLEFDEKKREYVVK